MSKLTPYLFFEGNCRTAMEFYKRCFGGNLEIMTYGDAPPEACGEMVSSKDRVMHSCLTSGTLAIMASDTMEGVDRGDQVQLCVACESNEEIERLYQALSEKGKPQMGLQDTFWGARFGTLTDQFGVTWMLNFDKNKR